MKLACAKTSPHTERIASVTAAISALATLACCLPFGIAGALAAAGLSVPLEHARPWLLSLAALLLLLSVGQMVRRSRQCRSCGWWSMLLLGACGIFVFLVAFFPQVVAGAMERLR